MAIDVKETVKQEAAALLKKTGFPLTDEEWAKLEVNDFGLGDVRKEGFAFIDILRSPRVRITLLILLPNQTLPQHVHPAYKDEHGKEETFRVLVGQAKIFIKGEENNPDILIPAGKEEYYTARHEIVLNPGEQYSVQPQGEHWFQGGDEGGVGIIFQNRVDETKNMFYDPASSGCPIKPTDK